ncbi:uncharacterized protein LOC115359411 [Myripristis murdjan]|uniref:uncharacterized protein LOC115359411 n=1 Tax=Myripristis murdjan TaxID=586833 RepID=UPI001175D8FC|nr:uncharacterized protein LOC115359411 [Myripristis murdjan]
MDGVLEGAAVLCACKLACSLPFLPSVTASFSAVAFCCCSLLIFTDLLVTVFLTFVWIAESWLPQLSVLSDVIALRFLLFLSHTYGAVLLLITPLIGAETVTRLLWPHTDTDRGVGDEGCEGAVDQHYCDLEVKGNRNDGNDMDSDPEKGQGLSHVIGYLCCLSVWIVVGLSVRRGWKLEEVWAAACMHTTGSLVGCLPGPMPSTLDPCWVVAFVSLLLFLSMVMGLHRRHQAPAHTARTHRKKHGADSNSNSGWQHLVPALSVPSKTVNPGMWVSEPAQHVDPEKTQSSCTVHTAYSWNSIQMSPHHHGDFVLLSPKCLPADWGRQECDRTKRGIPLAFITLERMDSQCRSLCGWRQWGFPCLGVNIMTGLVGVLSVFVLPLNLSVNILLIRTLETLLELCIKSLVPQQQIHESSQSLIK